MAKYGIGDHVRVRARGLDFYGVIVSKGTFGKYWRYSVESFDYLYSLFGLRERDMKFIGEEMPKVYNKIDRDIPEEAVYVGRPSEWGNPFRIGKHGDRTMVLKMFEYHAQKRLDRELDWLDPLIGKDLICWCAPKPCHADILLRLARERQMELTILEVVGEEWMTIPEITPQVAEKLGIETDTLGDQVAYYTGSLIGKDKLENKAVTLEGDDDYYYMCRKVQPKGD